MSRGYQRCVSSCIGGVRYCGDITIQAAARHRGSVKTPAPAPPRSGPNYFIIRPWENIAEHYGGSPPPSVKVSTEFHDNFYTIRRRLLVESAWHLNKVSPSEIELGHLSDNLSGQVFQFQVKRLRLNRFLRGKALVGTFNK